MDKINNSVGDSVAERTSANASTSSQTSGHEILIQEVDSKMKLRKFIHLPAVIHKNHTNWVPPIYMDEWEYFDLKKNLSFQSCYTILLLAYREDEVVGRIMGIIHRKYNELHKENHARFAYFETFNDDEVATALIGAVENWGKEKGMEQLVGPLAFSEKDPQGFLIEGFDEPVVIASNCNYPYQVDLLEKNAFIKKVDLVVYQIKIPDPLPEFYRKINERAVLRNPGLHVLEFTSRRKVKPYIYSVLRLLNLSFTEIYGFIPFSEKEMDNFANRYLFLINPRFIKLIVTDQNELIAFVVAMSHIGDGIIAAKGYLFPFGIFKIFAAGRKSKQLNLLLGGIDPAYRGKGIDVMMGVKMLESARALGKTTIDSHLELEDNMKIRAEMEKLGGRVYKRFRIFSKKING